MKRAFFLLIGIVGVAAAVLFLRADVDVAERADVRSQGTDESVMAAEGASLTRSLDGIRLRIIVPTPAPGSYEYPTGDMIPEGAALHPEVVPGGPDDPEVFTLWVFVFNHPERCTDSCDFDDLALDAPAKGGVYQGDGRVAVDDELELSGAVRLGQAPVNGSALENPLGAEVHLAIAPHGRKLDGADGWRQLNGPLGNPSLWWAASFLP
jgi:hypothetical protein